MVLDSEILLDRSIHKSKIVSLLSRVIQINYGIIKKSFN